MEIINKVAESGLITLDLEELIPAGERVVRDLKPWLYEEVMLKEADFRKYVKEHNWEEYRNKFVAVTCSADAVIPLWAYMLVGIQLAPVSAFTVFGNLQQLNESLFRDVLNKLDLERFRDQRVVIKGCSKKEVPVSAYLDITTRLQPIVKSLMFGEPCSTVPLYKRK